MKLLADTNVFIDFWNNLTDQLTSVFEKEDIYICGIVRAELLHGTVSKKNFNSVTKLLDVFDELNPEKGDWQKLGEQLYSLRRNGLSVPISDVIIASIAIKNDISVWTRDHHFKLIQNVLTELRLYEERWSK